MARLQVGPPPEGGGRCPECGLVYGPDEVEALGGTCEGCSDDDGVDVVLLDRFDLPVRVTRS